MKIKIWKQHCRAPWIFGSEPHIQISTSSFWFPALSTLRMQRTRHSGTTNKRHITNKAINNKQELETRMFSYSFTTTLYSLWKMNILAAQMPSKDVWLLPHRKPCQEFGSPHRIIWKIWIDMEGIFPWHHEPETASRQNEKVQLKISANCIEDIARARQKASILTSEKKKKREVWQECRRPTVIVDNKPEEQKHFSKGTSIRGWKQLKAS